jgi:membrane protein implicated in regulation of membrane protease activity
MPGTSFVGIQIIFAYCALIGAILFTIRLVLLFLGFGHDVDQPGDIDHSGGIDHDHTNSDVAFKLLSLQGMMAFLVIFGAFGLAMSTSGHSNFASCLVALAMGLVTVWLVNRMFHWFSRFQHAGNLDINNAIGETGLVYLTIPSGDIGKVTLNLQGRLVTLDARATISQPIPTDSLVVVRDIQGSTLVVEVATEAITRNEKE